PVALAPTGRPVRPEQGGRNTRACEEVRERQGHVLHRAPRELPGGPGGRLKAEGDLLHPCRGLCGRRAKAWPARARDPVDAHGRDRGPRPDVREDAIEHRGGVRPRIPRPGNRLGGRQGAPQVRGRRVRGPRHPVDLLAGAGERGAPALRLRSRADPRLPDRQAAEPREERHRRMNFRRSLRVDNRYRGRPSVGLMSTIEVVRKDHLTPGAVTQGIRRDRAFEAEDVVVALSQISVGTTSAWHHHGTRHLYGFLVSGRLRFDYGRTGKEAVELAP